MAENYGAWRAYCQSKLATLLCSLELDRIARAEGWKVKSIAAHARDPAIWRRLWGVSEQFTGLKMPIPATA